MRQRLLGNPLGSFFFTRKQNLFARNINDLGPFSSRPRIPCSFGCWVLTRPRNPPATLTVSCMAWPTGCCLSQDGLSQAAQQLTPKPPWFTETKADFHSGCTSRRWGRAAALSWATLSPGFRLRESPGPGIHQFFWQREKRIW